MLRKLRREINCQQTYLSNSLTPISTFMQLLVMYTTQKSIACSQALRFNRICSENQFFNKRCNDLEVWLKNRGYNEKLVRRQILKALNFYLRSHRIKVHKNKLVFNITYYPICSKLKNILSNIHLLLTPDREHRKVFENVPIIGFKKERV